MRKVIKILLTVVSSLILATIILPLVIAALLGVPAVQNVVVDKLTSYASELVGIDMDVEKVRIRGYNQLEIEGLYMEDRRGDTMLYVQRAKACIRHSFSRSSSDFAARSAHSFRRPACLMAI